MFPYGALSKWITFQTLFVHVLHAHSYFVFEIRTQRGRIPGRSLKLFHNGMFMALGASHLGENL